VQWDEKPKAKTVTETAQNQAETGAEPVPV